MIKTPTDSGFVERAYSICSSPVESQELQFCYKYLAQGVSTSFFETAPLGTQVELRGPLGFFTLNKLSVHQSTILVAAGTGIAPFRAMIADELMHKKNDRRIHLLFGVRSEEDIFWEDFLRELASTYDCFSFEITLSQPSFSWRGKKGRVTEHLARVLQGNESRVYLCGSPAMVKHSRDKLISLGTPPQYIHFEIFT